MKGKQRMLVIHLFWSTKNKRSDFSQKCKKKPLILFAVAPVIFRETDKLGELSIKRYLHNILKVLRRVSIALNNFD